MPPPQSRSRRAQAKQAVRRVALFAFPGGQTLDATGPYEVFAAANRFVREERGADTDAYRIELVARRAGPLSMSSGLVLYADRSYASLRGPLDTLLVCGGEEPGLLAAGADPGLAPWLRRVTPRCRRFGSVCSGAFLLAEAGLLDGRRATTHWNAVERLAARYPEVRVEPDAIYVRDGAVVTSAGVTAGMDLALALVEEDVGREAALAVARRLVVFLKRPGGQSQFSAGLAAQTEARGPLAGLTEWVIAHPDADLSVEALAQRCAMSPRHFARVFAREMGTTPARFVARVRLERAQACLDDPQCSLAEVALRCGFGSEERMRKTFLRQLRVLPRDYQRHFA